MAKSNAIAYSLFAWGSASGIASKTLASTTTRSVMSAVAVSAHFSGDAATGFGNYRRRLAHLDQFANRQMLCLDVDAGFENKHSRQRFAFVTGCKSTT